MIWHIRGFEILTQAQDEVMNSLIAQCRGLLTNTQIVDSLVSIVSLLSKGV